jgi:FkbM family methyltransferase
MWRLGRALYYSARGETANAMASNGEFLVQERMVRTCRKKGEHLVALDVGANIGDWSRHLLQIAEKHEVPATIFGFEPVPGTHRTLVSNLSDAIAAKRFIPVPHAVSNTQDPVIMHVLAVNAGRNSLYKPQSGEITAPISVECTTLTAFAAANSLERIHLVKCDAEGHDPKVIMGALPLLKAQALGVLQFEYNHCWVESRHFLKDIFEEIRGLPYVIARATPGGIEGFETWHPELEKFIEGNYLIVHHNCVEALGLRMGSFDQFNSYRTNQR